MYRASPRLDSAVIRDIGFELNAKGRIVRSTGVSTSDCAVGAGSPVRSAITPIHVFSVSGERQRTLAGIEDLLACFLWSPRVCQFPYGPHLATERFQVLESAEQVSM